MNELETARERLAECEAAIAAGLGGPYAEKNRAAHLARVTRLEAETGSAPIARVASTPAPAATQPRPVAVIFPQPTGTREQRLRRLAAAMGASERVLEAAIDNGTSPDEFALQCIYAREVEAKAREILDA